MLLLLLACDPKQKDSPEPPESQGCAGCGESAAPESEPVESKESPDSPDSPVDSPDSPPDSTQHSDTQPPPQPGAKVILFIGDGMGFNHVDGGSIYAYGAAGATTMESLPYHGRFRTASYTGVTDSAASATAMATGRKTWNGYLGVNQNGQQLTNIREQAASYGMATGIVTSDTLVGATPAAFLSHVDSRGESDEIASQIALDPPDVLLGGGSTYIVPAMETANVQWLYDADDVQNFVDDGRDLVGVFSTSTFPFVKDQDPNVPSLATLTTLAIDKLSQDEDGFFLMVEGARIDHASHANDDDAVYPEVQDYDEAIAAALAWYNGLPPEEQDAVTILVTADHECGGIWHFGGSQGVIPTTYWRWNMHTNADVPVFGLGAAASVIDGQRLDNSWVHSILEAAMTGTTPQDPAIGPLPDGYIEDLGPQVATQLWETSYGVGYNQLDGIRVMADGNGLWVGLDGVFEYEENTVAILVDLDYGAGTGVGLSGVSLSDTVGTLDNVWTAAKLAPGVSNLGFDLGIASMGAQEVGMDVVGFENAGTRGFTGQWGDPTDIWWLSSVINFDDGNVADYPPAGDGVANDASTTGLTVNGIEAWVPWWSLYPNGLPASQTVAIAAVLLNDDGTDIANQVLPPQDSEEAIGSGELEIVSVVVAEIGPTGNLTAIPYLAP